MLEEGSKAPDFELTGTDGKKYRLSSFRGRNVVLYFYPKDDTSGCTIEAKGFNESLDQLRKMGAEVIGISNDSIESHMRFCDKYSLKLLLLSDPGSEVIKLYEAYGDKGALGFGTLRKTYIIDRDGTIKKIFKKVQPQGHNMEVISTLG